MLQRVAKLSPLVLAFVIGALSSASANTRWAGGNEEDAAAPVGSFTSDMTMPATPAKVGSHGERHRQRGLALQTERTTQRPVSEMQ